MSSHGVHSLPYSTPAASRFHEASAAHMASSKSRPHTDFLFNRRHRRSFCAYCSSRERAARSVSPISQAPREWPEDSAAKGLRLISQKESTV